MQLGGVLFDAPTLHYNGAPVNWPDKTSPPRLFVISIFIQAVCNANQLEILRRQNNSHATISVHKQVCNATDQLLMPASWCTISTAHPQIRFDLQSQNLE